MSKYYVISPNVDNNNKNVADYIKQMFTDHSILMGWGRECDQGKMFYEMQKGDCVICARGANSNKQTYFAGIVASDASSEYPYEIKLSSFVDLRKADVPFSEDNAYGASDRIPAIYRLKKDNAADANIIKIINSYLKSQQSMESIKHYTSIIEKKKNIILQGAPGTGKTYSTASVAVGLCNPDFADFGVHDKVMDEYERLRGEGQIEFVTFHQSMDYEDFVEGMKPTVKTGGVEYAVEDGIFKTLCLRARKNLSDSEKAPEVQQEESQVGELFDHYCEHLEQELNEKGPITLYEKSLMRIIRVVRKGENQYVYSIQIARDPEISTQGLTKSIVVRDYPDFKKSIIKKPEDIKPTYKSNSTYHGNATYYFQLYKRLAEFEKNHGTPAAELPTEKRKNYVLVIDEINRGNVSRIFGELITLLEADKRVGRDAVNSHPICVRLPYSKNADDEYNGFAVPDNLYIIGTMNTTDRSTGTLDYALRRRFAFVTLKSDPEIVKNHYEKDADLQKKAVDLFKNIRDFIDNPSHLCGDMSIDDLMVGHSYFMADDEAELKMKMEYEVLPLINEYINDGILNVSKEEKKAAFSAWKNLNLYQPAAD